MMLRSDSISELAQALSKAQAQIKGATKDSTNPHFKSRYADLASVWDACRDALAANGLAVSQHPAADGQRVEMTTILMHTSGQWLESVLAMTAQQATPQAIGSAITYARRYALMSVVGIAADDDDGQHASTGAGPRANDHGHPAQTGQSTPYNHANMAHQNRVIKAAKAIGVPTLEQVRLIGERLQAKKAPLADLESAVKEIWEEMQQ